MWVSFSKFPVHFTVALLIFSDVILQSLSLNLKELFTPENEELLLIMKEELEKFQIDMTRNFMQKHSRRKRALDGHVKDIEIQLDNGAEPISFDSVGPFSTFTFAGNPFLIQREGIFQIDGLATLLEGEGQAVSLVQKGSWSLDEDEIVLNGFEWRRNYFLVTRTGSFSSIYTLHENALRPVFRQNIHNKATAVGAEFFEYRRNLYMVVLNDNDMRAPAFSTVFRWAGSYMDEIHQVQTTGASAVKTFSINSKKYIAIAQSRDSSGNTEVGTVVLSMDHMDRLERVQLLWSNGANDLHYMHTDKEHFLAIAQENEPSIVYWFGGMDFIYWQQLDDLQGENMVMEGVQLSSDDPILIASDGNLLKVFSRSTSATKIMTTWIKHKEFDIFSGETSFRTKNDNTIAHLNLLKTTQNGEDKMFLAITKKLPGSQQDTIQMYPVDSIQRPISISLTKQPTNKVDGCLQTLRTKQLESEEALNRIEAKSKRVLTVDGNWDFQGNLKSTKVIKPATSQVQSAEISPAIQRAGNDRFDTSPSVLMDNMKQSNSLLELMKTQLNDVVYKSSDNDISGNLKFLKNVQFNHLDAGDNTNLNFTSINDVSWEQLDTFALRKSFPEPQQITAEWAVESVKASSFKIANDNSKLSIQNFMLKKCESSQSLSGPFQFNNGLKMVEEIKLEPETTVNSIQFSDIVMKESENREIKGVKHAPFVTGAFSTDFVNNENLQSWFASVAKISGSKEQIFTGPVEVLKDSTIKIDNAVVEDLNGKSWKEFHDTVMLNGVDQEVEGPLKVDTLKVDNLRSKSISGMSSADLLTSNGNQRASSTFHVEKLEIKGPLSANLINGIQLTDAVNRHDSHVQIEGPVTIENFKVQDIFVPEGVLIADKDVSELASMKKVHEYSTVDGSPIFLKTVEANSLTTSQIDEEEMDNFPSKYWSNADNNVQDVGELILDGRKVVVSEGNFKTQKLNRFSFPDEFVSLDENQEEIVLQAPLRFNKPVTVTKDVSMAERATVEGIDMSEAKSMIVDENFNGVIRGKKTFASPIKALEGAHIENLNGINPVEDVVMRNSDKLQRIEGSLSFDKMVKADHVKVDKGDVHVKGLVNEENLAEVKDTTVYKNKENRIEGDVVFTKGLQVNKFSTTVLNKVNVKEITDNMVFLDHPETQTFEGHLILEDGGAEFLKDSTVGTMNNVAVHDYLSKVIRLDSTSTSVISGTKTFKDAILTDTLMCTTFNGVDIKELNDNAFSKSKSQEITGKWSLNNANFEKNLEATEIGQVSVDNIVFTDEPIEVSSTVDFISKQTSVEGPLSVEGHVNGVKFDEKMNDGVTIQGMHNFKEVTIEGNLEWENDRPELQRLSYFFENAVTRSNPQQTILGDVSFKNGFQSQELHTPEDKWMSDINLRKIQSDAVTRDASNLEITGHNTFKQPLNIQNSVGVNALNTDTVNSVDLHKLDKDIVRKTDTSGRKITGNKALRGSLQVQNLNINEKISDISVNDMVVSNDPRAINQVHFEDLQIDENVDWESTSGIDLKSLLDDRVSLTKDNQNLEGTYDLDEVIVENEGGCSMPLVNDITVTNVVKKSDLQKLRTMSGQKVFKSPLTIKGSLDTPILNNHPVKDLTTSTLHTNKPAEISRPVIFEAPVVVNRQLKIESINDIHLEQFTSEVSQRIARLLDDAQSPGILSSELSSEAMKLQKIAQERPVWLEYLRMKKDMTGLGVGAQSRVDQVQVTKSGDVMIVMHRDMDGEVKGGLPKGCSCNSVVSLTLDMSTGTKRVKRSSVKSIGKDSCLNVFNVESPNMRSYSVIGETISSNTTCVTDTDSTTRIFRGKLKISDTKMGHISDAGVFSENQDDFLVLAQYFDKNTRSHSTVTRIMRVDKAGKLENVQNIETHGARKVALNKVDGVWMLAIANSKNSEVESSCNADSAIYQWSSEQTQFLLMRTIMTDGAFDVEFITTETSNEFYKQNFVAFAQNGDAALGEVMILRYEQPEGIFKMAQTIRSKWPVTGLRTVNVCRQSFLVTVVPQEGITFYENRFVEGFQEYYKAPVFGATDISGFKMNDQHLFAIATDKGPVLAEAVVAGSCPN